MKDMTESETKPNSQSAGESSPRLACSARRAFEAWIQGGPFERNIDRYPNDETLFAWPGNYREYEVQLAWEAWKDSRAHWRNDQGLPPAEGERGSK